MTISFSAESFGRNGFELAAPDAAPADDTDYLAGDGTWKPIPGEGGVGNVATDGIFDAAGDLAVGSGPNTAVRLPRGTALQALQVNAAGTDIEWGTVGITDGDKGDITVSASGTVWAINSNAVTYAKMQNVSATDKILGRSTAGAGTVEEITCTPAARSILDDLTVAAILTTLGGTQPIGTGGLVREVAPTIQSANLTVTPTAPTAGPGTNTTQIATTEFTQAAITLAAIGLLDDKGGIDCSTNPNYPAALKGDVYTVTVAGKIGGVSGIDVEIGDSIRAGADNAGGTHAAVGSSWYIAQHNLVGALLTANNLSDVNAATARTNLGLTLLATTTPGTGVATFLGTPTIANLNTAVSDADLAILAANTFTGAQTITSGTLTASTPALSITQTWNNGAVTFEGAVINVTSTAAAAASRIFSVKLAGNERLGISSGGDIYTADLYPKDNAARNFGTASLEWLSVTTRNLYVDPNMLGGFLRIGSDAIMRNTASYVLALINSTNAMKLQVYGTASGTPGTDYERAGLNTGADYVELAAETGGAGDDDLDVRLTPAGTGKVRFGTHSALAAETVSGYITIKDSGGTIRKLAVVT